MRIIPVATALVLAAAAAGCSSSSHSSSKPAPAPVATTASTGAGGATGAGTVHDLKALSGNRWSVGTLQLKVGDTVKVTDTDPDVPHNFTVKGLGHSPTLRGGDTYSLRFTKAGTFDFVCTFHVDQGMEGTIKVS